MKQRWIVGAVALCGLVSLTASWAQTPRDSDVVAVVYQQNITRGQLISELMARHGAAVLESLIMSTAIEHQARQTGVTVSDEQVNAAIEQAKAQIVMQGGDFAMWLVSRGLTETVYRQQVRLQMLLEAMVKDKVVVTEAEIGKFYEDHKDEMRREEGMQVAHIVVGTQDEAEKLRDRIIKGEISWDDAAKQYSLDPYGRDNGGVLLDPTGTRPGWVYRDDSDEFRKAIFALQSDGEITPVVRSQMGFEIAKRLAYRKGGIPPFEEVKDGLKQYLESEKLAEMMIAHRDYILRMGDVQRLLKFEQPAATPPAPAVSGRQ